MEAKSDFLAKESELLFDEIERYNSNSDLPLAAKSLLDFQRRRNVDTTKELHLPTPLLGFRGQKVSVLVMSICGEFRKEGVRKLPKNAEEMMDYFRYSEIQGYTTENNSTFDYVRNFKQMNYFRKIDWILNKIWGSEDYELGNLSVYADIIPWPTPTRWKGFQEKNSEEFPYFREYGAKRVRRILEDLDPEVIISLGMQASEFLGDWDVKINNNNIVSMSFTNHRIPMVSLYKPVADNEVIGYSQLKTGLFDWQNKFLAHLDKIQEYLGL